MQVNRARVRIQFILRRFVGKEVTFTPRTPFGARLIAEGKIKGVIINARKVPSRFILYELDLGTPGRPLHIECTKRTFTLVPEQGTEE